MSLLARSLPQALGSQGHLKKVLGLALVPNFDLKQTFPCGVPSQGNLSMHVVGSNKEP